jgi:type IV secretion system protein VirB1
MRAGLRLIPRSHLRPTRPGADMVTTALLALALACSPLVDSRTVEALVRVESGFNPHAIGVVGGTLARQPRNRGEALATTSDLQAGGWNFSVGLAQINVRNFPRLGLSRESAFDPCENLAAMQIVLTDCFDRASQRSDAPQRALRQALSCYYSGNFVTGFRDGYVDRVVRASRHPAISLRQSKESS